MMIPLGILASGMKHAAANITGADGTVWAGGSFGGMFSAGGSGGSISRISAVLGSTQTLTGGQTYTITVGAGGNSSSALGVTVTSGSTTTRRDTGVNQAFSQGGTAQVFSGWYYPNYFYGNAFAYGGGAGAAGNGGSGSINAFGSSGPTGSAGGPGSGTGTYIGSGISGLGVPTVLSGGGGGGSSGTTVYNDYTYAQFFWEPGKNSGFGGTPSANSGNGGTPFNNPYSGGFVLSYSSSQPALTATTGTVTTVISGGVRYYFWQSSGSFTV